MVTPIAKTDQYTIFGIQYDQMVYSLGDGLSHVPSSW